MSKGLNETRFGKKVRAKIEKYGRLAEFFDAAGASLGEEWITPPRQSKDQIAQSSAREERFVCLIPGYQLQFTPDLVNRVVDGKDSKSYRIISIQPLDSGENTAAWRLNMGS